MNHFSINTIALGNLRQHKKTYLYMTVGIVLALFFSSSLLLFWNSMQVSTQEIHNSRYGAQDIIYMDGTDEAFDILNGHGWFSALGKASILEYISQEDPSSNSGFSAAVFDDTALQLIDWKVDGRLPEKAGEIAVEQTALSKVYPDATIGDTITVSAYIPTGMDDAFLDKPVEKTYTVVGILSDHYPFLNGKSGVASAVYRDFPCAVLSSKEQITIGGKPVINYYATYSSSYWIGTKLPGENNSSYQLAMALHDSYMHSCETHGNALSLANDDTSNTKQVGNSIMIIAAALMIASCLGIMSAFSASLHQRQRQIGMLRAVAATRRQIRQIFGRETILIALISIPPAMLLSCLAVWGIMGLMGESYHFALNAWVLLVTAFVGLLCIMAASFFPVWKVSCIPPMQAVRDVSISKKMTIRRIRTRKLFDVSKHLAKRSLSLNRSNQVRIVALMTAGMVMLCGLLYLNIIDVDTLRNAGKNGFGSDFSLISQSAHTGSSYGGLELDYHANGMTEQDLQDVTALQSVQGVQYSKWLNINVIPDSIDKAYLTNFGSMGLSEYLCVDLPLTDTEPVYVAHMQQEYQHYLDVMQKYGYTQDYYSTQLQAYDEEQLNTFSAALLEGEIHPDKLASGEEVLVYAPAYCGAYKAPGISDDYVGETYSNTEEQTAKQECTEYLTKNTMFHAGDTITLSWLYTTENIEYTDDFDAVSLPDSAKRIDREVTIGGVIDKYDSSKVDLALKSIDIGSIVTSTTGLDALRYEANYDIISIFLSETPDKQMERYLEDNLQTIADRSGDTEVQNHIAWTRENRNITYGQAAAGISIIILLFVICTWMICNSFVAQIQASKSYIGTLRATGASERDIWNNYFYQLIYLFVRGGIIGIPFTFVVLYGWILFRRYFLGYINELEYLGLPPILPALVFLLGMFAVCYCATRRKLKQVLKSSIVENIREL